MVKAGKRDVAALKEGMDVMDPGVDSNSVLDDVDELIMCLDCEDHEGPKLPVPAPPEPPDHYEDLPLPPSPSIPDGSNDAAAIPWLDRFEATERLIVQLEDTLDLMGQRGINLTSAWELANTARALLDNADVTQALIYANRSFRLALEVHRLDGSSGVAAS
jgi:hypothetical protein